MGSGTDAHGGDKQWMTIDRTNGAGSGNIYSWWTSYYSFMHARVFYEVGQRRRRI